MTERLFDIDSYTKEFNAICLSSTKCEKGYLTVLDKTAFFPEGGGQKGDTGVINGVRVLDTFEKDREIFHLTEEYIPESTEVSGSIDWDIRFYRMQNHTAEHIISGIVHKLYGYDNVGFHLGEDFITMDYNGMLTLEQAEEIELLANKAVYANKPVKAWYPDDPTTLTYRSKLDLKENVRIVEIEGVDTCACCAPHVRSSIEAGMIKILSVQKFKSGVRMLAKCGHFAYTEMCMYQKTLKKLSAMLSLPPEETADGVKKLMDRMNDMNYELNGLRLEVLRIQLSGATVPYAFTAAPELLKDAVNMLKERFPQKTVGAFCGSDEAGYRFMIITPDPEGTKALLKERLNANGGGRDNMIQGSAKATQSDIEAFFK